MVALGRADATVLAVTKTFSLAHVDAAARAGVAAVGENYAREFADKRATGDHGVRWHFLGRLQTNKIALVARHADLVGAVARERELEVLARQSVVRPVDIEVDTTDLPGRPGAPPAAVEGLVAAAARLGVPVRGLMTVAPPDPAGARACFATVAALAADVGLNSLSMGMSDDYEAALELGATEIRLGRALFGPREDPIALP